MGFHSDDEPELGSHPVVAFRHGLPKTRAVVGERINVTWRRIHAAPE
jgi:hypothetical protein